MYIKNKVGPRTELCRTSDMIAQRRIWAFYCNLWSVWQKWFDPKVAGFDLFSSIPAFAQALNMQPEFYYSCNEKNHVCWGEVAVIHMNVLFWIPNDLDIIFDEFPSDSLFSITKICLKDLHKMKAEEMGQ